MIKICITGPESTGKTVLAQQLAEHFSTVWEPELAREYVENIQNQYTYYDVCEIAKLQIEQEKKYVSNLSEKAPPIVFFDTDLITTKVWLEYKYQHVPEFVTERLNTRYFDLYLLCNTDIEWEPDPVREHGDDREFFLNWYKNEIEKLETPYFIISGTGNERLKNAIQAVKSFMNK